MEQMSECIVSAEHPALAGHFPGSPVVPGVVLLEEVLRVARAEDAAVSIVGVDGVKFLRPLLPQQPFTVQLAPEHDARWRFECRLAGERIAIGYLILDGAG